MQSFHDATVNPKGDPTPDVAGQNQSEGRVDRLEQEVSGIRGDLSQLMRMMESMFSQNAARPESAHQNPPDPHPHQVQALPALTGRTRLLERCSNSRVRPVVGRTLSDRSESQLVGQICLSDPPAGALVGQCLSDHRSNTAVRAVLEQPCSTG
ncbi:hypothetical protein PCANC_01191 [Puccinia coronata f. sp. avenae]|uniref:Uncharacterized protein n=1 Tax=Puccinia coronata f. sp. avenae TaxID=200324 RepID=A0A2N5W3M8_9BASI|nr:hypothetical protein PCANC_01191 [Puccinia coronata f. sp. avenae]